MVLQRNGGIADDYADELKIRLRQQAVVAELGQKALASQDLQALMDDAARKVAQMLGVDYCQVLEYDAHTQTLLMRAGVGWKDGSVGSARDAIGEASQAGFTLQMTEPVIVQDWRNETRFQAPQLLGEHRVISGMSIVIPGDPHPFGVFAVHTKSQRDFTKKDVNFLRNVVNILAASIERQKIEAPLPGTRNE